MTNQSKPDRHLTQLKLALTAGGLMATLLGAGLLGRETNVLAGQTTTVSDERPAITTSVNSADSTTQLDAAIPEALNLNLEAVPTVTAPIVTAPTMRSARVATGRSSA